jgi:hypothetical protein
MIGHEIDVARCPGFGGGLKIGNAKLVDLASPHLLRKVTVPGICVD